MYNIFISFKINIFKVIFFILFLYIFASCDNSDLPSTENTIDNKTYIKLINNTEFDVNVYVYEPRSDTNPDPTYFILAKSEKQSEISHSLLESGDPFYFEYLIPVGSIIVPNYDFFQDHRYKIEKEIVNTITIPNITSTTTNSSFIVIENDSSSIITVQHFITSLPHSGQAFVEIQPGKNAVYILRNTIANLQNHTVGTIINRRNFPPTNIQSGRIYSFKYDNSSIYLYSETPFDINARNSIWSIPTFNTPAPNGRFFTTGLLSSRANVKSDGYILTGRVNYNHSTVMSPHVEAISYLGMISPTGAITRERKISLGTNPVGLNLESFIEINADKLVYTGQVYYRDSIGQPCIFSTDFLGNENYFYDNFINDINDSQELVGQKLVRWNNDYAIGCQLWESGHQKARIYIAKVTEIRWDAVTHAEFWMSPEEDYAELVDLIFDQTHNMLVVLARTNTGSTVYFIDAITGTIKYPTVNLDNYWINGMFTVGNNYYIAGGYRSVSRNRGFITNIDVVSGMVDTNNPWLIDPTQYQHGAGSFWYILPENDGTLILAGWCVENNSNADNSNHYLPWLVKYNLSTRTKIWEQVYNERLGYYINSVHHNAIGSYLLEIHNSQTYHSYIVSTDLLGKMSTNLLAPLPRSSSSEFVATQPGNPKISINIIPLSDANLSTPENISLTKGQNVDVIVQGTWSSYQWYVNGSLVSSYGSTYTFATSSLNAGIYTVTAIVTNSVGERRSAGCRITVTN
ncbi:MAG: hypothetical protein FWD26_04710 [Treponema sp.]|nr:hypothetical protein [Treponema sp.]